MPTPFTLVDAWPYIRDAGLLGALFTALWSGQRGAWVFRWVLDEREAIWCSRLKDMTTDRDGWRDVALDGAKAAKLAVKLAESRAKTEAGA
jgi:hypothetical protein